MSSSDIPGLPAAPPSLGVVPELIDPPLPPKPSFAVEGVFVTLMLIAVLIRTFLIAADGITYLFSIIFTKTSIPLLYQLLFGVNRIFHLCVRITIVIFCFVYIPIATASIVFLVRCNIPENAFGHNSSPSSFCSAFSIDLLLTSASFNVATDFWLLLLPMPIIAKLQVSLKQKLGIGAVFAGGLGACIISLARFIVIVVVRGSREATLDVVNTIAELSIAEVNIGSIVACFPRFYNHVRGWLVTLRKEKKDDRF
ncbi:hypothetical protein F5B17DRAFT_453745 [Nemania serpens]|nr:hypothetical protein F5B17DRAFT_453745 [Nemania serpens]